MEVSRVSPEAPAPVIAVQRSETNIGGAGNVARNIAALGGKAVLLGLVGRDAAAAEIAALIKETAGGPLRFFLEIHSNSWPEAAGLVLVGTSRVTTTEAFASRPLT